MIAGLKAHTRRCRTRGRTLIRAAGRDCVVFRFECHELTAYLRDERADGENH